MIFKKAFGRFIEIYGLLRLDQETIEVKSMNATNINFSTFNLEGNFVTNL